MTPEYLGKKIEPFEMKMAMVCVLVPCAVVLLGTAVAVLIPAGFTTSNPGAHGFSQILYAFSSAGNNNGSAFAGLTANTPFYNIALGLAMWFSRFWIIVPVLAVAGSLAAKKVTPATSGTLPTHTPVFVLMLVATVVIVVLSTLSPALALGRGRRNTCSSSDKRTRSLEVPMSSANTPSASSIFSPVLVRPAIGSAFASFYRGCAACATRSCLWFGSSAC